MSTYRVECEWEDGWWTATATPRRAGLYTQARRLDQIPGRMVEVVKLVTGTTIEEGDVEIVKIVGPPAIDHALLVKRHREEAMAALRVAELETESVIAELRAVGFSVRDAGRLIGISYQRVAQLAPAEQAPRTRRRRAH